MAESSADTVLGELSAQHLTARTAEDPDEPGRLLLVLGDGEQAVEITHDIGDPEAAARHLLAAADAVRAHAEQLRYKSRQRTAGWT